MLMVLLAVSWLIGSAWAIDNKGITFEQPAADCFTLIEGGKATPILLDEKDDVGIVIAAKNLQDDFRKVTGSRTSPLREGAAFDCGRFFGEPVCQGTRKGKENRYNLIERQT